MTPITHKMSRLLGNGAKNHAIKGTEGAEVIPELKPEESKDYIVEKRTYSGFYETGLDPLLRSLYKGEGVKTVVLGGLHTHMCVRQPSFVCFLPRLPHCNCQRRGRSVYPRGSRARTQILRKRL